MRMAKFWARLIKARSALIGMTMLLAPLPARAQLPAPNPLVAPVAAPSAPALLTAPVQPQGLPSLVAVPSPPAAASTPAARVFNCSCFGPAVGTSWMGQVNASGFFAARQEATGACLSFNRNRAVTPPALSLHQGSSFAPAATLPQGFENPNAAGSVGTTLPGELNFSSSGQLKACSQCACD
jgi:hypothetical protein